MAAAISSMRSWPAIKVMASPLIKASTAWSSVQVRASWGTALSTSWANCSTALAACSKVNRVVFPSTLEKYEAAVSAMRPTLVVLHSTESNKSTRCSWPPNTSPAAPLSESFSAASIKSSQMRQYTSPSVLSWLYASNQSLR